MMNSFTYMIGITERIVATVVCATAIHGATPDTLTAKVDDFSDPQKNSMGIVRQFLDDSSTGGRTTTTHSVSKGILSLKGKLIPLRGQPAWASTVLLLDSKGLPQDASKYQGILLRVRVNHGNLYVSANSSEVKNFDYHSAPVTHKSDGKFHDVKIPFSKMKRGWSAPTRLNTKTLTSLSLAAFGIQTGAFDFEIDEVRFY